LKRITDRNTEDRWPPNPATHRARCAKGHS
jgi:hypothetical protein